MLMRLFAAWIELVAVVEVDAEKMDLTIEELNKHHKFYRRGNRLFIQLRPGNVVWPEGHVPSTAFGIPKAIQDMRVTVLVHSREMFSADGKSATVVCDQYGKSQTCLIESNGIPIFSQPLENTVLVNYDGTNITVVSFSMWLKDEDGRNGNPLQGSVIPMGTREIILREEEIFKGTPLEMKRDDWFFRAAMAAMNKRYHNHRVLCFGRKPNKIVPTAAPKPQRSAETAAVMAAG